MLLAEAASRRDGRYTRPGKRLHNYGKSTHFSWEKLTISMAIFNSYVKLPEGKPIYDIIWSRFSVTPWSIQSRHISTAKAIECAKCSMPAGCTGDIIGIKGAYAYNGW